MLTLAVTAQFRGDYKRARRRGYDLDDLERVIDTLLAEKKLEPRYRDHPLEGGYAGFRECHISPDWLLIYGVSREQLVLTAVRTGTHADLFGK